MGTDAAVGSFAEALLWLASLWLAIGLLATLATAMTGQRHGLLDAISRRFTPELVRRLVLASTGASIALSPIVMAVPRKRCSNHRNGAGWPGADTRRCD